MESALQDALMALETTEIVASGLKSAGESNDVVDRLIRAIEDDRAALLASILHARAVKRAPVRTRREPFS